MIEKVSALILILLIPFACSCSSGNRLSTDDSILCVAYDPTRELFQEYNDAFIKHWNQLTGRTVTIRQSHGASGSQARAVIGGLEADAVILVLASDIEAIREKTDLIASNWQSRFPHKSSPFTSTIVFLVRKGNPKGLHDWADLIRPGVSVITPNPKTSGGAKWIYLAAWGFAVRQYGPDEAKVRDFVTRLYRNVPVLDAGSRAATITFAKREIGDVLLAWENEAFLAVDEVGVDKLEVVIPPVSIRAEPSVAVVDAVVAKRGNRRLVNEYLSYLYSQVGQEILARNFFRPRAADVARMYSAKFPQLELFTIDDLYGSWREAQQIHFTDGGIFDQIYQPGLEE